MIRTAILAVAALIALSLNAEASQQHRAVQPICDNMDVMRPFTYQPNFLAGIRSRPTTSQATSASLSLVEFLCI